MAQSVQSVQGPKWTRSCLKHGDKLLYPELKKWYIDAIARFEIPTIKNLSQLLTKAQKHGDHEFWETVVCQDFPKLMSGLESAGLAKTDRLFKYYKKVVWSLAIKMQTNDKSRAREKLRAYYKIAQPASTRPVTSSSLKQQVGRASDTTDSGNAKRRTNPSSTDVNAKHRSNPHDVGDAKRRGNPLDIDSPAFESKRYLKKVLVEQGVSGLLRADNELVTQVRQIDGEMKTMVYENYSKFISATETIRKMKQDADYMDAEMGKLSQRVNRISAKTSAVNAKFADRREHIHRLSREHRLLSNLQFLFALPEQLGQFIGAGRFVDAARAWARTQPLLHHYRQLGVFAGVEKDGKEMMASVEAAIWERWNHSSTGMSEGAECASLLVLLRPDRASELSREYLEIQGAKNRLQRQTYLEEAYECPVVSNADAMGCAVTDPDPSGTPLPGMAAATFPAIPDSQARADTSRIAHFNKKYLPVWSSLVVGFASQFVSPAGSGLLEQVAEPRTHESATARSSASQQGRTMSLLEATTSGTVVGLLSPLADDGTAASAADVAARLASLTVSDGAAGVKISSRLDDHGSEGLSNLKDSGRHAQPMVGWQAMSQVELGAAQQAFGENLREWAAEYEFIIDSLVQQPDDASGVEPYLLQLDELVGGIGAYPILVRIGGLRDSVLRVVERWQRQLIDGVLQAIVRDMVERLEYYFDPTLDQLDSMGFAPPRRSSASRHQRNTSVNSTGSQASMSQGHHRSGSVMSGTPQLVNAASPHSPLTIHTQPSAYAQTTSHMQSGHTQTPRGLAHARAVSSAFEALSNAPANAVTLSPQLPPFGQSPSLPAFGPASQRLSRASTVNQPTGRVSTHSTVTGVRAGALRRARHRRTLSSALGDMADATDDARLSDADSLSLLQPSRRSLSFYRGASRRYRPWLVGSVNRSAPLHVFLAESESWLIQQILERVNPVLERVMQHYLDIEGSQLLDEGASDSAESAAAAVSPTDEGSARQSPLLPLQTATKMRQSFIKTLDASLDAWMSTWVPDAFLYAALANPAHGTRAHVDATLAGQPMAQLGVAAIGDPVSSLLLARFAMDFELTLAQTVYQLCEHGISIAPGHDSSALSSADVSTSNLLGVARGDVGEADRLQSITASARADSIASSRRGTMHRAGSVLTLRLSSHAAKWHAVAERLVRNFVMTVGQDISADYLSMHNSVARDSLHMVSDGWLGICRWMRRVEDDTNALFYDPVFSGTLKALDLSQVGGLGDASSHVRKPDYPQPSSPSLHAHILSNIDRLFAERVDVFPKTIDPLNAGQILLCLALQTIKTALEALRLRPVPIQSREFQQIIVDATFVRAWMLRYAGVVPNVAAPSVAVQSGNVVNERDARAVHNLVDDWINSAKACAVDTSMPNGQTVDRAVFNAWMAAYFGQDAGDSQIG
ncbi:hypothetical protein GGF49_001961 [Coemansia sp. RSA 1853]|nr:hypothetical protein GGF49_001961 [Coemansia sp. RSA 1853]